MSGNSIGSAFVVTSFGESHGPAIGCVIDGCPPNLQISTQEIQKELDRRKPGTSRFVTQRKKVMKLRYCLGSSMVELRVHQLDCLLKIRMPVAKIMRISKISLDQDMRTLRTKKYEYEITKVEEGLLQDSG